MVISRGLRMRPTVALAIFVAGELGTGLVVVIEAPAGAMIIVVMLLPRVTVVLGRGGHVRARRGIASSVGRWILRGRWRPVVGLRRIGIAHWSMVTCMVSGFETHSNGRPHRLGSAAVVIPAAAAPELILGGLMTTPLLGWRARVRRWRLVALTILGRRRVRIWLLRVVWLLLIVIHLRCVVGVVILSEQRSLARGLRDMRRPLAGMPLLLGTVLRRLLLLLRIPSSRRIRSRVMRTIRLLGLGLLGAILIRWGGRVVPSTITMGWTASSSATAVAATVRLVGLAIRRVAGGVGR